MPRKANKSKSEPERVTVDGYGVIEIFGDYDASALHLNFAPVVTEAWDMGGSAGRFALHLPKSWHDRPGFDSWMTGAELARVRNWLAAPPRDSRVVEDLAPLLRLLAAGEYEVEFAQMPPVDNTGIGYAFIGSYHHPQQPGTPGFRRPVTRVLTFADRRAGWYDWDSPTTLLPTDHWPPRDTATVTRYRQSIRDGNRPAIVVLRTGEMFHGGFYAGVGYVIDGHHKLAAYLDEQVLPYAVDITAVDCQAIEASPAARFRRG